MSKQKKFNMKKKRPSSSCPKITPLTSNKDEILVQIPNKDEILSKIQKTVDTIQSTKDLISKIKHENNIQYQKPQKFQAPSKPDFETFLKNNIEGYIDGGLTQDEAEKEIKKDYYYLYI